MPLEILVGAAAGAAAVSPAARNVVRRGLLYGVAGALVAYDKATVVLHAVSKGVQEGLAATHREMGPDAAAETPPPSAR